MTTQAEHRRQKRQQHDFCQRDPRVRKDGTCAHCRGKRKLSGLKRLYRASAELDPFCRRECCVAWHAAKREKDAAA